MSDTYKINFVIGTVFVISSVLICFIQKTHHSSVHDTKMCKIHFKNSFLLSLFLDSTGNPCFHCFNLLEIFDFFFFSFSFQWVSAPLRMLEKVKPTILNNIDQYKICYSVQEMHENWTYINA